MNSQIVIMSIGAVIAVAGAGVGAMLLLAGPPAEKPQQAAVQQAEPQQREPQQVAAGTDAAGQDRSVRESPQSRRQNFADWALICPGEEAPEGCLIAQHHLEPESQRPVLAIHLRRAGGGLEAAMITPLYVLLKPGLVLEVGGTEPIVARFSHCINQQCQASVRLDEEGVSRLLKAKKAQARFAMATGQRFAIDVSIDGLGEALAALGVQSSRGNLLRR